MCRGVFGKRLVALVKDILLAFEVHQPFRIRGDFYWGRRYSRRLGSESLFDYYFDEEANSKIFRRVAEKAYLPTNGIILKAIEDGEKEGRPVNVAFSISGVFLEQCRRYGRDVLESFQRLAATGHVEFIGQTYYHSLAGFFESKQEMAQQVQMHSSLIREYFGTSPQLFENTEFLYNNAIASEAESMGFKGIFTEGASRVLGERSPNYVYKARGCEKIRVLLRNFTLTDDIAFRFSSRWWVEWPLTADKYVRWLNETPGDCIVVFPDYETFGEHQWPETGIHEFLTHLFMETRKYPELKLSLPSSIVERANPVDTVDVPELETISWADQERGTSSWLGNAMQWAYYTGVRGQEGLVHESGRSDMVAAWRYFQTSDHLYYMYTGGGGPGEVHSYFNPLGSPMDAFVTCFSALQDFDTRLREETVAANEPFNFEMSGHGEKKDDKPHSCQACSLRGFGKLLEEVNLSSLELHSRQGDVERWLRFSLRMDDLADGAAELKGMRGRKLREALKKLVQRGLDTGPQRPGAIVK
jgi:alpha-amylase